MKFSEKFDFDITEVRNDNTLRTVGRRTYGDLFDHIEKALEEKTPEMDTESVKSLVMWKSFNTDLDESDELPETFRVSVEVALGANGACARTGFH